MKFIIPAMAALLATTSIAHAADVRGDAQDFVKNASIGGIFEIESSKIALQRSQDAEVKTFAQKMIDEHRAAAAKLKAASKESGLKLVLNTTLDKEHQEKISELKKVDAKDFDDKYLDAQKEAHEKTVDIFEDYAEKDDTNPVLKTFANNTLPTLKAHEDKVEGIEDHEDHKDNH